MPRASLEVEFVVACFGSLKPAIQFFVLPLFFQIDYFSNFMWSVNRFWASLWSFKINPLFLIFIDMVSGCETWWSRLPNINKWWGVSLARQTRNLLVCCVNNVALDPIDSHRLVSACKSRAPNHESLPSRCKPFSLTDWVYHGMRSHSPTLVSSKGAVSFRFGHRIGKAIVKPYLRLRVLVRLLVSDFGRHYTRLIRKSLFFIKKAFMIGFNSVNL